MPTTYTAGRFQAFDSNGDPLSGGRLYTYAAGTLTPQATYTTAALTTPNANPVILDSQGRAPVWLSSSVSYRMILKTAADVTITDDDNIVNDSAMLAADLLNTASTSLGAGMVGFGDQIAYPAGTVGGKLREWVSPEDFGILTGLDQTAQITTMLTWAATNDVPVMWGPGPYLWSNIVIEQANVNLTFKSRSRTVFQYTGAAGGTMLRLATTTVISGTATSTLTADGGTRVSTSFSTATVAAGMLAIVQTSRVVETDDRGQSRHGWVVPVAQVTSGSQIELERPFPVTATVAAAENGTLTGVDVGANTITVAAFIGRAKRDMRYRIRYVTQDVVAYPNDFDPATGKFTMDASNGVIPAGVTVGQTIAIERVVDLYIANPVRFRTEGRFAFEKTITTTAADGDAGETALRIERAASPIIHNVDTVGFSNAGITLLQCYAFDIRNNKHSYCNRAWSTTDGTGIGVSIAQSSWGYAANIAGYSCRRTLDFNGTQAACYHNETENISGYGGGVTYGGARFWPVGVAQSSVCGSHGGSFGNRYVNSRGAHIYMVVNVRGHAEQIQNVYGSGRMAQMVFVQYGDIPAIDGLYYTDNVQDVVSDDDYAFSDPVEPPLVYGVRINDTVRPNRVVRISNFDIKGITDALVRVDFSSAATMAGFTIGPGTVETTSYGGTLDFRFISPLTGGVVTISDGVRFANGTTIRKRPSAAQTLLYFINASEWVWPTGSFIAYPGGEVRVMTNDDTVVKLPVHRQGTARVDIRSGSNSRTYRGTGMLLDQAGSGDKNTVPSSANVDVSASVLAGTTGTDGKVTLALCPTGGDNALYVEQRMGLSNEWIVLRCSEFTL